MSRGMSLPGNLYSGGAVTFNPNNYTQFYGQILAHRQAKEDAMAQYQQELDKNIAMAGQGMRPQDQGVLRDNENKRMQHFMQNRDSILNPRLDNGRAQMENQAMLNGSYGIINQSKRAGEGDKTINGILVDPTKRNRLTEDSIHSIHNHSLPINDPNFKMFDPTSVEFSPNEVDWGKYYKGFADIKMDKNLTGITTDPKTQTKKEVYQYGYGPQALNTIYGRAMVQYNGSKDFQDAIDKIHSDPARMAELDKTFQATYGHPIKNAYDTAAAVTLGGLQQGHTEDQAKDDSYEKSLAISNNNFKHQMDLMNAREDRQDAHQTAKGGDVADGIINFTSGLENQAKAAGAKKYYNGGTKTWEPQYPVGASGVITKAFGTYDPVSKKVIHPTDVAFTKDGDVRLMYPQYDKKGNVVKSADGTIALNPNMTTVTPRADFMLSLGKEAANNPTLKSMISGIAGTMNGGSGAKSTTVPTAKPAPSVNSAGITKSSKTKSSSGVNWK